MPDNKMDTLQPLETSLCIHCDTTIHLVQLTDGRKIWYHRYHGKIECPDANYATPRPKIIVVPGTEVNPPRDRTEDDQHSAR